MFKNMHVINIEPKLAEIKSQVKWTFEGESRRLRVRGLKEDNITM